MFFLKQLSRGCCAQTEATRGRQDCISGARVCYREVLPLPARLFRVVVLEGEYPEGVT
jgi:hypothetical protein